MRSTNFQWTDGFCSSPPFAEAVHYQIRLKVIVIFLRKPRTVESYVALLGSTGWGPREVKDGYHVDPAAAEMCEPYGFCGPYQPPAYEKSPVLGPKVLETFFCSPLQP